MILDTSSLYPLQHSSLGTPTRQSGGSLTWTSAAYAATWVFGAMYGIPVHGAEGEKSMIPAQKGGRDGALHRRMAADRPGLAGLTQCGEARYTQQQRQEAEKTEVQGQAVWL